MAFPEVPAFPTLAVLDSVGLTEGGDGAKKPEGFEDDGSEVLVKCGDVSQELEGFDGGAAKKEQVVLVGDGGGLIAQVLCCTASSAEASAAGASGSAAAGSEQGEGFHEYEKEAMDEMKVASLSGGEEPSARGPRSWEATVAANQLAHARAAAAAACRRAQWRLEHDELEDGSQGGEVLYADAPGGLCDQIVQACDPCEPGSEEHEAALARVLEGFGLTVDDIRYMFMVTGAVGKKRKSKKKRRARSPTEG